MNLIAAVMLLFVAAIDATLVVRRSLPRGFGGVSQTEATMAAAAFPGGITRQQAERAAEVFRSNRF